MRQSTRPWAALAALLLGALAGPVRADTVVIGGLARENVKILGVRGDRLLYEINGEARDAELSKIDKIAVPADKALTDAEEAFAAQNWDAAVDNYQKAIRSAAPPRQWIRQWASLRLVDAAGKTGRFDAAVTAYIALVNSEPAAAASARPKLPDAKSKYLDMGITQVEAALRDKLTDEQHKTLLQFSLDLYTLKKDSAKAAATAEQLLKLGGANNPRVVLNLAKFAFNAKDYQKAISQIEQKRAIFTDAGTQLDALYLLAEANYALAGQMSDAGQKEKALNDTALAYMRVVTHFKDQDKEKAGDSLLKVGRIEDELKQTDAAQNVYKQVVDEFPGTAAASAAKGLIRGGGAK